MLIEFFFSNFRSYKDPQTFSLLKQQGKELEKTNSFSTTMAKEFDLLRSSAIYGANASGKTNLLNALLAMRNVVQKSATRYGPDDDVEVSPHVFDENTAGEPTEFGVVLIAENIRYQYGFSATNKRIFSEWLIAYPHGRAQRWFQREWAPNEQEYNWSFGPGFTGKKQHLKDATRDNGLFLSTAVNLNNEQLKPVFNWFTHTLQVVGLEGFGPFSTINQCETEQKHRVVDFLQAAGLAIEDIHVQKEKFNLSAIPSDTPDAIKNMLTELAPKDHKKLKVLHKSRDGNLIQLDYDDESEGTKKLITFATPWLQALEKGLVLFVDELHSKLHPQLVGFLVSLFHSDKTNPHNAQLVFTTHETSILNQLVFRRDQIWFCDTDENQASSIYPLSDFKIRKDTNLETSYLAGKYGGVPYANITEDLINGFQ